MRTPQEKRADWAFTVVGILGLMPMGAIVLVVLCAILGLFQ